MANLKVSLDDLEDEQVTPPVSPQGTPPGSPRAAPDSPRTATRKRHEATWGLVHGESSVFSASSMEKWEHQQYVSFLKWVNYRLDTAGYPEVGDLVEDLRDGVALNRLLEALSGVTELLRHVHYNPRHPAHRMANLSAALNFATGRDGLNPKPIRLENIGAEDINDGNRVLIMGLLWSIILQYQIALFGYSPTEAPDALKRWVNDKQGKKVDNFTSDFTDGEALKGLISNLTNMEFDSLEEAMDVGEEQLGIPRMIEPEVLESFSGDAMESEIMKKCVMTYVSLFYDKYGSQDEAIELERKEALPPPPPPPAPPENFWNDEPTPEPEPEPPKSFPPPSLPPQERLKEGSQVIIPSRPELGPGIVRYVGNTKFKEGTWIGIELIQANGKNDGSVKKTKYFNCKAKHGIFVPPDLVITLEEAAQQVLDESRAVAYVPDYMASAAKVDMREFDKKACFLVEAKDQWGRKYPFGGDRVDLVITPPPEGQELKEVEPSAYEALCRPTKVEDKNDGTYIVEYLMLFEGKYILDVFMNGKPISNSRGFSGWTLDSKNRIFYPYLIIHGRDTSEFSGLTIGRQSEFIVEVRDTPTGDRIDMTSQFTILEGDREDHQAAELAAAKGKKKKKSKNRILTPAEKRAMESLKLADRIEVTASHSEATDDGFGSEVLKEDMNAATVACKYTPVKAGDYRLSAVLDGKWESQINPTVHINAQSGNILADDCIPIDGRHGLILGFGWNQSSDEKKLTAACFAYRFDMFFDYVTSKQHSALDKGLIMKTKNTTGSDIEEVQIDFSKIGKKVNNLLFMVRPKDPDVTNMSSVTNLVSVKLSDIRPEGTKTLARFVVDSIGGKAIIMGKLTRWRGDQWVFRSVGDPMMSRSLDDWTDPMQMGLYLPPMPQRRIFEVRVLQAKIDIDGTPAAREDFMGSLRPFAKVHYDNEYVQTHNAIKKYVTGMAVWLPQHLVRVKGQEDHLDVVLHSGESKDRHVGRVTIPLPTSTPTDPLTIRPAWYAMEDTWKLDGVRISGILRIAVKEDVSEESAHERQAAQAHQVPKKVLEPKEKPKSKKPPKKDVISTPPVKKKSVKRIFVNVAVENYNMIQDLPIDLDGKVSDIVEVIKGNIGFPVQGYQLFMPPSTKAKDTVKSIKLKDGVLLVYKPAKKQVRTETLAEKSKRLNATPLSNPNFDKEKYKEMMRKKYEEDMKASEEAARARQQLGITATTDTAGPLSPRDGTFDPAAYKELMRLKYEQQQAENERKLRLARGVQELHKHAEVTRGRRGSIVDTMDLPTAPTSVVPPPLERRGSQDWQASMDDNMFVSVAPKTASYSPTMSRAGSALVDAALPSMPLKSSSLRLSEVPTALPPATKAPPTSTGSLPPATAMPPRQPSLRVANIPANLPPPPGSGLPPPPGSGLPSPLQQGAAGLPPPPLNTASSPLPAVAATTPAPASLPKLAVPPPAGLPPPLAGGTALPPPPVSSPPGVQTSQVPAQAAANLPPPPAQASKLPPPPAQATRLPPPPAQASRLPPPPAQASLSSTGPAKATQLPPPPALSRPAQVRSSAVSPPGSPSTVASTGSPSGLPPPPALKKPLARPPPAVTPPQSAGSVPPRMVSSPPRVGDSGLPPPPAAALRKPPGVVPATGQRQPTTSASSQSPNVLPPPLSAPLVSKAPPPSLAPPPAVTPPAVGLPRPDAAPPPALVAVKASAVSAAAAATPPPLRQPGPARAAPPNSAALPPPSPVAEEEDDAAMFTPSRSRSSQSDRSTKKTPTYISVGPAATGGSATAAAPGRTFSASKKEKSSGESKRKHRRNRSMPDKKLKGLMRRVKGEKDKDKAPPSPSVAALAPEASVPAPTLTPPPPAVAGTAPPPPTVTGSPPPPAVTGAAPRPAARGMPRAMPARGMPPPVGGSAARMAQRRNTVRAPPVLGAQARAAKRRSVHLTTAAGILQQQQRTPEPPQ